MVSNYTLQQVPIEMEFMSGDSRVWVFQAERPLTDRQILQANEYLRTFCEEWQSHGTSLKAHGAVFYSRFVVICVDEGDSTAASGCSIDNMTHHIQHLGAQVETNLMERQTFYVQLPNGTIKAYAMHDLSTGHESGDVTADTLVFDTLVKTKQQFFDKFLVPVGESWHKRFL